MTKEDYKQQALQLLKRGIAWPQDGSAFASLVAGFVAVFARIDARAEDLLRESRLSGVGELLPDWEKDWGLPDDCSQHVTTDEERKRVLRQKVLRDGDHSGTRLHAIAAAHGTTIQIETFAHGESIPGRPDINPADAGFVMRITLPATSVTEFRAGRGHAGERLRQWSPPQLFQCEIENYIRAHKMVIWAFGG
jgi:uncharacterized protein YmfQ (DUF2313 family)